MAIRLARWRIQAALAPEGGRYLHGVSPMTSVLEGFRRALTGGGQPRTPLFAVSIFAVLLVLISGLIYFRRMQGTITDLD